MRIVTVIYFILAVIMPGIAPAQYTSSPNPPGSFTVNEVRGCVPFTVTVTAPDCDGTPGCGMLHDINDPASTGKTLLMTDAIPDTLIYSKPGTYTLLVAIGSQNSTIQITALPSPLPKFEAYACSGNRISLKVTDTNYNGGYKVEYTQIALTKSLASGVNDIQVLPSGDQNIRVRGVYTGAADNCPSSVQSVRIYPVLPDPAITKLTVTTPNALQLDLKQDKSVLNRLQISTNSNTLFQNLPNVVNTGTVSINSNVSPDNNNYYCFRIASIDHCSNAVGVFSNTLCSADFDVVAINNQNNFSWTTSSAGVLNFDVTRNTTALPAATVAAKVDSDVICNTPYTYQLISNYGGGAQSLSLPKTVTAISTDVPPPVDNISTVVMPDGGVQLSWLPGTLAQDYIVYRSTVPIDTTSTENSIDELYTPETNLCYYVRYKNTCGNLGPLGTEACPMQLTGQLQKDNSVILKWSRYLGWEDDPTNVDRYILEKYTTSGQLISTEDMPLADIPFHDVTKDLVNQSVIYVIRAEAKGAGIPPSLSNAIKITKRANLGYPNAFTPNNDGNNDVFRVMGGQFVSTFEMKVFNRWGEQVYSTTNKEDTWDGRYKGISMPEGTYAVITSITDFEGRTFKTSGSIVILGIK